MLKKITASILIIIFLNYVAINNLSLINSKNVVYASPVVIGENDTVSIIQKILLGVGFIVMGWQHVTEASLKAQIENFINFTKSTYADWQDKINSWASLTDSKLHIDSTFIDAMNQYKTQNNSKVTQYINLGTVAYPYQTATNSTAISPVMQDLSTLDNGKYRIHVIIKRDQSGNMYNQYLVIGGQNAEYYNTTINAQGTYYQDFIFDKYVEYNINKIKLYLHDGTTSIISLSSNLKLEYKYTMSNFIGSVCVDWDKIGEYTQNVDYYPDATVADSRYAVPGTVIGVRDGVSFPDLVGTPAKTVDDVIGTDIPTDNTVEFNWTNLWDWLSKILEAINPIAAIKTGVDAILEKLQLTELWEWLRQIAEAINPIAAIKTAIDAINGKLDIGVLQDEITGQLTDSFKGKFNIDRLTKTWDKLMAMDTSRGDPPVIKINLYAMANTSLLKFAPNTKNPFANEDSTLIDFGLINNYKFLGIPFVDLIRTLIGFGMLYYTLLHVWNKITPRQVIGE